MSGPPANGRALASLTSARVGVDVAGHRAEFLYWGYYEPRPWRNYLHTHSFFEICYAYAGTGVFRAGEQEHVVVPGTLFVARPGDVHEIVSDTDDPLCIHFWSYTLVPARTRRPPAVIPERSEGREVLELFAAPGTRALSQATERIPAVLGLLAAEAAAPGPAYEQLLSALAGALVVETARAVVDEPHLRPRPTADPAGRDERTVATMVRYLQDNYDRTVSVRDVAAQVHLGERQVGRLFRAQTGTTVHAYLTRLRLEIAAQRLLEHSADGEYAAVAEIARQCGYPDVRHFTTAFRRHWGVPPGAFRDGGGTAQLRDRQATKSPSPVTER
ncbi:helix-turn-helix domain-containing protein [Actinopolymorpha singaporensis]|uniref:AraC-like ligand binding domain-containing protein n=1 Tax=Actinopolymorpha singaporensis TaxID=117157 RepID=A0A1H1N0B0_9ACTN|nr:AraC family transcriptional regulator [Actinopolymorpha singaporensis]SDR92298.1 AraC-like ligand binding domain-containing protein [Actinopolymorpha singaporensis]